MSSLDRAVSEPGLVPAPQRVTSGSRYHIITEAHLLLDCGAAVVGTKNTLFTWDYEAQDITLILPLGVSFGR